MKNLNFKKILLCSISAFLFSSSFAQTLINKEWDKSTGNPSLTYDFTVSTLDANNRLIVVGNSVMGSQKENFLITKYNKDGSTLWQSNFDKAGMEDFATAVATYGNETYVTGVANEVGNGDFNYLTMKLDANGGIVWVRTYNGTGNATDAPTAIKLDASGNVFVTGGSTGNGTLMDFCTIKYDKNGNELWVSRYDYNGNYDGAIGLDVDPNGTSVVTGASGTSFQNWDFLTMKLDANGNIVATERTATAGNGFDKPVDIKRDDQGNIYIAGSTQTNGNDINIKLIKISSNFQLQWQKTFDGAGLKDEASEIDIDANGNVYLAGYTEKANGGKDLLIKKYGPSGVEIWERRKQAADIMRTAKANGLEIDVNGNIYVTGETEDGDGEKRYVTEKYDPSGAIAWEREYKKLMASGAKAQDIRVDNLGNIYVVGKTEDASGSEYTSVKYNQAETFFPPDNELASSTYAFYENQGQIFVDSPSTTKDVMYYTNFGHPQFYVGDEKVSYVFANVDGDSTTIDSIQRIDLVLTHPQTSKYSNGKDNLFATGTSETTLNYLQGYLPEPIEVKANNRLVFKEVYPGIDWQLYSNNNGIKHYFVVYPGANPYNIGFEFLNKNVVVTEKANALAINAFNGILQQQPIKAYEVDNLGNITPISVNYVRGIDNAFTLKFGNYNSNNYLIIESAISRSCDPAVLDDTNSSDWSTFFGGNGDDVVTDVATDRGSLVACGYTTTLNFPNITSNIYPVVQPNLKGLTDAFIAKFDIDNKPVFTTYFGGSNHDMAKKIVVKEKGVNDQGLPSAYYIVGATWSNDINKYAMNSFGGLQDGFMLNLTNIGKLSYTYYIGGTEADQASSVCVDDNDNVYVIGSTNSTISTDFIRTKPGAYNQSTFNTQYNSSTFIQRYESKILKWGTYFGGNSELGQDITVGENNSIYIAGTTMAKTMASSNPSNTPCGVPGTNTYYPDCNPGNGAYFQSTNNANTSGNPLVRNAFLAEFNESGTLTWSTVVGGSENISDDGFYYYGVPRTYYSPVNLSVNPLNRKEVTLSGRLWVDANHSFPAKFNNTEYNQISTKGVRGFVFDFRDRKLNWGTTFGNDHTACTDWVFDNSNNSFAVGVSGLGKSTPTPSNVIQEYSNVNCSVPNNVNDEFPNCIPSTTFHQQYCVNDGTEDNEGVIIGFNYKHELIWSTFYGGSSLEMIYANAFDKLNNFLYVGGESYQTLCDFPLIDPNPNTPNRYFQSSSNGGPNGRDGFIGRFKIEFPLISGIADKSTKSSSILQVYPNPSNNLLNVSFPKKDNYSIEIQNISGQTVYSYKTNSQTVNITLNISTLASGLYMIKAVGENGTEIAKFTKQ